jgi:hypothetical protein
MPKKNEKLIAAMEEITELKLQLVALHGELKQARQAERVRIARELLKEEGE